MPNSVDVVSCALIHILTMPIAVKLFRYTHSFASPSNCNCCHETIEAVQVRRPSRSLYIQCAGWLLVLLSGITAEVFGRQNAIRRGYYWKSFTSLCSISIKDKEPLSRLLTRRLERITRRCTGRWACAFLNLRRHSAALYAIFWPRCPSCHRR